MILNDTWFSMRADATYVRSGYYSAYNKLYDYAKVTYNVSCHIVPNDEYWWGGTFYTTSIENIIAVKNSTYCIKHCNYNGYTEMGLDFYEVKADFYKKVMSLISRIVSQEPVVTKNKA